MMKLLSFIISGELIIIIEGELICDDAYVSAKTFSAMSDACRLQQQY